MLFLRIFLCFSYDSNLLFRAFIVSLDDMTMILAASLSLSSFYKFKLDNCL